jgi:hypothetical protein
MQCLRLIKSCPFLASRAIAERLGVCGSTRYWSTRRDRRTCENCALSRITGATATFGQEKNRLHKLLDNAGIKLSGVAADIDGVCARKMVEERRLAGRRTCSAQCGIYQGL